MDNRNDEEIPEAELDRMERLVTAATDGPWFSYVVGRDMEAGCNCIETGSCATMELLGGTVADQDFIANAREDFQLLIFEVRRLRRLLGDQAPIVPIHMSQHDRQARRPT